MISKPGMPPRLTDASAIETRSIPRWAPWLLLASVAAIYTADAWVALEAVASPEVDLLSWAVVADLVILVPLLVWLVGVKGLGWSWTAVVPSTLVGFVAAGLLVPAARGEVLADLELALIPLELGVLGFIAWRARAGWIRLRSEQSREAEGTDPAVAVERAAAEVVGKGRVAEVLAFELLVQLYAFSFWRKPLPEATEERFSLHRRSGFGLLIGGALVATAAEIVPVHFLLHYFVHPAAGWVLTALSLYGGVFLLAHWQAVRHRPIELGEDTLLLRTGLLWQVVIPYRQISELRTVKATEVKVEDALQAHPAGRPSHCLELSQPVSAQGPYGLHRETRRIAFFVDEPGRFETALRDRLAH